MPIDRSNPIGLIIENTTNFTLAFRTKPIN